MLSTKGHNSFQTALLTETPPSAKGRQLQVGKTGNQGSPAARMLPTKAWPFRTCSSSFSSIFRDTWKEKGVFCEEEHETHTHNAHPHTPPHTVTLPITFRFPRAGKSNPAVFNGLNHITPPSPTPETLASREANCSLVLSNLSFGKGHALQNRTIKSREGHTRPFLVPWSGGSPYSSSILRCLWTPGVPKGTNTQTGPQLPPAVCDTRYCRLRITGRKRGRTSVT